MVYAPCITTATLSSTALTLSSTLATLASTLVTLSSIVRVAFRISAVAIRASSCVSLSSRFSASSRSVLPKSFFAYFSEHGSVDCHISVNVWLTRSTFLDLLSRNPKNRQHFHQYLNDDICHFRGRRHLDVNLETSKKCFDAFKDVNEGVLARSDIPNRLKGVVASTTRTK